MSLKAAVLWMFGITSSAICLLAAASLGLYSICHDTNPALALAAITTSLVAGLGFCCLFPIYYSGNR